MNDNNEHSSDAEEKKSQLPWVVACVVLTLAIIGVFFFALLPKLTAARSPKPGADTGIDFSSSAWLDSYMKENAGLCGMDFADESALSCGSETGVILYTYASEKSVEELRELYKTELGAAGYDRNDETALHLKAETKSGSLTVVNSFSAVCRVLRLTLTLSPEERTRLSAELTAAFPEGILDRVEELKELRTRKVHGCSVRYRYDDMDACFRKGAPIFSRAFPGTSAELELLKEALTKAYENHISDTESGIFCVETEDGILALGRASSAAGEELITVMFQPGA